MLPHWTEDYVKLGTLEFHYTRTGRGDKPPLLLLHGFTDNGLCWQRVAHALETAYDVIMPDAKGHGRSARVQADDPIDNAADAAGIITALGLEKPVVMGHSMGGLAATELGARFPDLPGALILEDPAWIDPSPDDAPLRKNPFFDWLLHIEETPLAEIVAFGRQSSPTWAEEEFPAWAASKQQLDKGIFKLANMRKPWRDFVAALTVPTLLITAEAEKGAIITPAQAAEAAARSPQLQIAHVPDAGHNIRRENYTGFMQAVQDFLSNSRYAHR